MSRGDLGLLFVATFDPSCLSSHDCLQEITWSGPEPSPRLPRLPCLLLTTICKQFFPQGLRMLEYTGYGKLTGGKCRVIHTGLTLSSVAAWGVTHTL